MRLCGTFSGFSIFLEIILKHPLFSTKNGFFSFEIIEKCLFSPIIGSDSYFLNILYCEINTDSDLSLPGI